MLNIEFERMDYVMLVVLIVLLVAFAWTFTQQPSLAGLIVADTGEEGPSVTLNIDNGKEVFTYNVPLYSRDSAFDSLKRITVVNYDINPDAAVITEVNGVKNDGDNYWICLVNGKMPDMGCDHYYPNDGNVITFKYTSIDEISEYF
jgi:hypothetical protein